MWDLLILLSYWDRRAPVCLDRKIDWGELLFDLR
jgi:hypothetical protein